MSVIQGGFFTIARASVCIFCAIIHFCCSMINLLCGVLRGENKQAVEINSRMKNMRNMRFPEIHIYSILFLSMASTEKLKVLKRPVIDELAAVPSEKLYGNLGTFCTNYNPLKKLLAGSCKVGLGIVLSSSPFVDNFGKKKVIINTDFPNKQHSLFLLSSSSSSSLIGHDLEIVSDQSPIGMLIKKTPLNLNPLSIFFIGSNNNNNVVVSDQIRDHILMENICCVFGSETMSTNNSSKKLIAICRKHRNAGYLSLEEIEKTDNYSRKLTNYLPNLKVITHMYNYCILEFPQIQSTNNNGTIFINQYTLLYPPRPRRRRRWSSSSDNNRSNFLKNCQKCDKLLEGQDIYIYRGESSFCSPECRYWKMNAERNLKKVQ